MSLSEDLELARLLLALRSSTLLLGVPSGLRNLPCGFSATMLRICEHVHKPHYSSTLYPITLSEGGRAIKRQRENERYTEKQFTLDMHQFSKKQKNELIIGQIIYIVQTFDIDIQISKWLNPPQHGGNLPESYNLLCPLQTLNSGVLSVPRTVKLRVGGKSFFILSPTNAQKTDT